MIVIKGFVLAIIIYMAISLIDMFIYQSILIKRNDPAEKTRLKHADNRAITMAIILSIMLALFYILTNLTPRL